MNMTALVLVWRFYSVSLAGMGEEHGLNLSLAKEQRSTLRYDVTSSYWVNKKITKRVRKPTTHLQKFFLTVTRT